MPLQLPKLLVISVVQAAIIIAVFTMFFLAIGVGVLISFLLGISVFALIALAFHLMTLPFYVLAHIRGAVYVPSADDRIAAMMKLAKITSKTKVAELGSGDGRVMIAFAKKGATVTGFEINPILVKKSQKNIADAGVAKQCTVEWKSFWDVNLSEFDIVMVYGIPHIMVDLGKKLRRELRPGAQILSNAFELPGWTPIKTLGEVKEYRV